MKYFKGEYSASLNSEDLHNQELSLTSSRSKGGSMVFWKKDLDPYISLNIPDTTAFLSVRVDIPGFIPMFHLAIYLPTAGKDSEFLSDLASMRIFIERVQHEHPAAAVFVRGDCNASQKNTSRHIIFSDFCSNLDLIRVQLHHNTYHHFMGQGRSDSELDVILYSNRPGIHEKLVTICCKHDNPEVDSHHDLLLSVSSIPPSPTSPAPDTSNNIVAPKLEHSRYKIIWTEGSLLEYETIVSSHLARLRESWLNSSSKASITVLLQATNMVLSQAASLLNKTIELSSKSSSKSLLIPAFIKKSNARLVRYAKKLRIQSNDSRFSEEIVERTRKDYKILKNEHRKAVRLRRAKDSMKRDGLASSILSDNPAKLFRAIAVGRKASNAPIKKLYVDGKQYEGDQVCDGFYDSISFLKTVAHQDLHCSDSFKRAEDEYENIVRICRTGARVPRISLQKTRKILNSIRPSVSDYASITALHYRYAGEAGMEHLQYLINGVIDEVDNLSIDDLNVTSACILHKSHGKDKSLAESYRTISSCPFLSKCVDTYIGEVYGHVWEQHQSGNQFQGRGSSHDLAALLLTEAIQHSLRSGKPIFVLYLDAKSAFDLVIRQFLVNKLYHYGIKDQGLLVIDQRLKNRKTICEWNGLFMGPIHDEWGLEQGGKNSSEYYKVFNNSQLEAAQESALGVDLGGTEKLTVSAIGQADDVALVSNDIFSLKNLLHLSLEYCRRHHVQLRANKTKLQAYSSKSSDMQAYYAKVVKPIVIGDQVINFSDEAEHVGLIRSTKGNLPHINARIISHRNALTSVLPFGLARSHWCNPAASLRIVAFLGGVLPGTALLHIKQLGIFGMVTRKKGSILWRHGLRVLTVSRPMAQSCWVSQVGLGGHMETILSLRGTARARKTCGNHP